MSELQSSADRPFRVCLFGTLLDSGNMGCSALVVSVLDLILERHPDAHITQLNVNTDLERNHRDILIGGREVRVEIISCQHTRHAPMRDQLLLILIMAFIHRFIPPLRSYLECKRPWLKRLAEADFIGDIRGGDSFSDIYGFRRFLIGSLTCLTATTMGKRLTLLPQTYGPFHTPRAVHLARFVFKRAYRILARDQEGIDTVNGLLPQGKVDLRFCPDVAFALASVAVREPQIEPPLIKGDAPALIGLNVSGLLYGGGYTGENMFGLNFDYTEFTDKLLARILDETDAHVLLTPHVFAEGVESDHAACRKAFERIDTRHNGRVHLVTGDYDQNEIKGIIGGTDCFIGARMHSCIAALSQEIPTVGVAYSKKFLGVFNSVGVDNLVADACALSLDEMLDACMKIVQDRDAVREQLRGAIKKVREKLESTFDQMLSERIDYNVF